jgi:hypothetical protein
MKILILFLNNILLYVLIILFLLIILYSILNRQKEGFNVKKTTKSATKSASKTTKSATKSASKTTKAVEKGTTKAVKETEKGTTKAVKETEKSLKSLDPTKAIKELESWIKNIDKDLKKTTKQVQKAGNDIKNIDKDIKNFPKQIDNQVIGKFTKFFTQLGDILNKGIIKPLETLFIGIGNIFVQIFNILMLIGNKIVGLPGCIFYYIFDGIFAAIYGIFKLILPRFLMKWIIDPIASFFNFFLDWFGYNAASRRCRAFNVNQEVNKMNNQLTNIDKSFKKDFGKLDFKKIKL